MIVPWSTPFLALESESFHATACYRLTSFDQPFQNSFHFRDIVFANPWFSCFVLRSIWSIRLVRVGFASLPILEVFGFVLECGFFLHAIAESHANHFQFAYSTVSVWSMLTLHTFARTSSSRNRDIIFGASWFWSSNCSMSFWFRRSLCFSVEFSFRRDTIFYWWTNGS